MAPHSRVAVNGVPHDWQVRCCDTFLSRARGRLASPPVQAHYAWRLKPCRAVHTFFLSQPIDVVFCDANETIVRLAPMLPPWRCIASRVAACTWEFAGGAIAHLALRIGDRLTSC
jgi:hypothetical protein